VGARPSASAPAVAWPRGRVELSTERLPTTERFDYWHEVICRVFVELDACRLAGPETFGGSVRSVDAGPLQLTRVDAQPHRVTRSNRAISHADDQYFLVSLQLEGSCGISQDGRTARLGPGDFALYDTTRPYQLNLAEPFSMLVAQMPRDVLRAALPQAEAATAITVHQGSGVGSLVRPMLGGIAEASRTAPAAAMRHLAAAAIDLIAASLADVRAAPAVTSQAVQLLRARQCIEDNLVDPDLSPEMIARAIFVSPRYLHAIFHDEGTSVSRYVIHRRLERSRRDLADARLAHLTIADIAARLGFKDASHFTRVFKAAYGVSPREHRAGGPVPFAP
jgi:AraC-like DNA-binding protein